MNKLAELIGHTLIIGGTAALVYLSFKEEYEHNKTRKKLKNAEFLNRLYELKDVLNEVEIRMLKEELEKIKNEEKGH